MFNWALMVAASFCPLTQQVGTQQSSKDLTDLGFVFMALGALSAWVLGFIYLGICYLLGKKEEDDFVGWLMLCAPIVGAMVGLSVRYALFPSM
ncbi:MAG: hypothetical protein HY813_03750 [Candidatus Portnoybacteria bacterium]|nr:hypothetical protein [Candidatus Portnoybacteria bacterium]